MAGYSRIYVVGGRGGFEGADGVNPIAFQILLGQGNRQWLEAHYFDSTIRPIGNLRVVIPEQPDHPNALLDACIAFFPDHFKDCPSFSAAAAEIQSLDALDFDMGRNRIPASWWTLRKEARPRFNELSIWYGELVPLERGA